MEKNPEWTTRGKTIRQLIVELSRFEDQDIQVKISIDEGEHVKPISLVGMKDGVCVLMNAEL